MMRQFSSSGDKPSRLGLWLGILDETCIYRMHTIRTAGTGIDAIISWFNQQ